MPWSATATSARSRRAARPAQTRELEPMAMRTYLAPPQQHRGRECGEAQQAEEPQHRRIARRMRRTRAGLVGEPAGDAIRAPEADVLQQRDDAERGAEAPRIDDARGRGPDDRRHQRK